MDVQGPEVSEDQGVSSCGSFSMHLTEFPFVRETGLGGD